MIRATSYWGAALIFFVSICRYLPRYVYVDFRSFIQMHQSVRGSIAEGSMFALLVEDGTEPCSKKDASRNNIEYT